MVKKRMYQEIKRLQRLGYGKNKISRELGIDKKTVRKYWSMNDIEYCTYVTASCYRNKEYDIIRDIILDLYDKNDNLKLPVSAVYDYLEESLSALPANENSLRNYIRYLEETGQLNLTKKQRYYIKVDDMPYGKQLQIDFGEKKNPGGGKYYIFAAVLSASRFKYASLQDHPFTAQDLIGHLLDCFDYINGIPEELVIDQDSIMVVDENKGDILYTKVFGDFIKEMDIGMFVCRKADPESKGKIENFVKYIKYNFFAFREFRSLAEAQESLMKWLVRRANGKISQATKKIPLIEIEEERKYLKQLKNSIHRKDLCRMREERTANDKSRVAVDACLYDLPSKYRNRPVEIYKTETILFVFDKLTGEEIAEHSLSLMPGQTVKSKEIAREMSTKAGELKEEVTGYFSFDVWKLFLDLNFKIFDRYARDQCLDARKHFRDQDINTAIFKRAVDFCIENQTYSMANLNDTYRHFLEKERTHPAPPAVTIFKKKSRPLSAVDVSKPDLQPYLNILKATGGHR